MENRRPAVNAKVSLNKKQVQSRCFTMARRDFDGAEEDIVLKVVEYAQKQIYGFKLEEMQGFQMNVWGDVKLRIRIPELSDRKIERTRYRDAARHLVTKLIEIDLGTDEKGQDHWLMLPFFQRCEKIGEEMEVQVAKEIWDCMLDFSKKCADIYSIEVALSLKSQYSKRIYMIISQSSEPMRYSLETLNRSFNTKYTAKMFEKRVLEQAKKELDKLADWSIEYTPYYPSDKQWEEMRAAGIKGRKPILGWTLTPVRIHNVETESADLKELERKGHLHMVPKAVKSWLILNMEFDAAGVSKNSIRIYEALKVLGNTWEQEFDTIKAAMAAQRTTIKSRPGYFLQCLANRVNELQNPLSQVKKGVIGKVRSNRD